MNKRFSPAVRWRMAFGLLAAALLTWLILADKPWQIEVTGKMRLMQVVALWSCWAALANVIVLGGLMVICPWWAGRIVETPAFAAAPSTLSALPTILLILPLIPQARLYFEHEGYRGIILGWPWIKGALILLLNGGSWTANAGYPAINVPPVVAVTFAASVILLLIIGLLRFVGRGWLPACLALTILASPDRFRGGVHRSAEKIRPRGQTAGL